MLAADNVLMSIANMTSYFRCSLFSLGGLSLHDESLEVALHFLDIVSLLLNLVLMLSLEVLQPCNLLIDEGDTLSNDVLALKERLFDHNGANHLENACIFL